VKARLRQPLFWIVVCEVIVMFALFIVSWRVFQAHRPVASAGAAIPTALAPATASPVPSTRPHPVTPRPVAKPVPSPHPAAAFPIDLEQLNRDQADLERSEDALLVRMIRTARDYLEGVVLPAVRRAERVKTATSPAATQSPAAIAKMP
jgi:2-methylaconitate cis-trans-isomerase PrpF